MRLHTVRPGIPFRYASLESCHTSHHVMRVSALRSFSHQSGAACRHRHSAQRNPVRQPLEYKQLWRIRGSEQ